MNRQGGISNLNMSLGVSCCRQTVRHNDGDGQGKCTLGGNIPY